MSWYAGRLGLRGLLWIRRAGVAWGLCVACFFQPVPAVFAAQPPAEGGPIHFTQGTFHIPFQVRPGGRSPAALDLLVSRDGGRTWHVHQTATPAEKLFHVIDADEGDYLVKVQARDRTAIATGRSAMRLVVDRTPPQVELLCQWQAGGRLTISSTATDDHLDVAGTQLELRTSQSPQFRKLAFDSRPDPATGSFIATSQIELEACTSFEVRCSVADLAGNRTVYAERFSHPLADDQSEALPSHIDEVGPNKIEAVLEQGLEITANDWSTIDIGKPVSTTPVHTTGFVTQSTAAPARARLASTRQAVEVAPPQLHRFNGALATETRHAVLPKSASSAHDSSGRSQLQSGPAHVHSHSQRLVLAYGWVHDQQRPESVELWCSRDGQNWAFWGEDADCQSPCRVQVDSDGDYHFRIVPIFGPADIALRPQAGDRADIVVTVASGSPPSLVTLKPVATSGF